MTNRTRLPWMAHAVAWALGVLVMISGVLQFGIVWDDRWWWPWYPGDIFVLAVLAVSCCVVAPVAALLEALAVHAGQRVVGAVFAVGFLFVAGYVWGLPALFRLVGDDSPVDASGLAMSLQAYTLCAVVQLVCVRALLPAVRRTPIPAPHVDGTTRNQEDRPAGGTLEALHRFHERLYRPPDRR